MNMLDDSWTGERFEAGCPAALSGDLVAYLSALVVAGTPPLPREPRRAPTIRKWSANLGQPLAKLTTRREEFTALGPAKVKAPPTSRRAPSKGMRSAPFSAKAGMRMLCYTKVEGAQFEHLEVDPNVRSFLVRPGKFRIKSGKKTEFSPSFYAEIGEGRWLFMCMGESSAAGQEERLGRIGRAVASLGVGFEVITEHHVIGTDRAIRIGDVWRSRTFNPPEPELAAAIMSEVAQAPLTFSELLKRQPQLTRWVVLRLVLDEVLRIDLGCPIESAVLFAGRRAKWAQRACTP